MSKVSGSSTGLPPVAFSRRCVVSERKGRVRACDMEVALRDVGERLTDLATPMEASVLPLVTPVINLCSHYGISSRFFNRIGASRLRNIWPHRWRRIVDDQWQWQESDPMEIEHSRLIVLWEPMPVSQPPLWPD